MVNGNHAVANTSFHWTGSMPLAQNVYLQALNHSGMFQPTRLVQEGSYWYTVVFYIHRDFSQINPSAGVYEAPIDKTGYVLLRTSDFTDPNSWQAWNGGSDYEPIANETFQTFDPKLGSTTLNAAPPQLLYDATAHVYVLMHTLYGVSNAVYYMSTASPSTPVWSDSTPIVGTARMVSDPGGPLQGGTGSYGPVTGFNDSNYPSMIDAQSPGYNFEFISGGLYLFYSTSPGTQGGDTLARDVYRVPLAVTYQ